MKIDGIKFGTSLSEQEIEHFFDADWICLRQWTEGEGRGASNYEILMSEGIYIISSEHYGFDGYLQPTYHYIENSNNI